MDSTTGTAAIVTAFVAAFSAMIALMVWLIKVGFPEAQRKADERVEKIQGKFSQDLASERDLYREQAAADRTLYREESKENRNASAAEIAAERELCRDEFRSMVAAIKDTESAIQDHHKFAVLAIDEMRKQIKES